MKHSFYSSFQSVACVGRHYLLRLPLSNKARTRIWGKAEQASKTRALPGAHCKVSMPLTSAESFPFAYRLVCKLDSQVLAVKKT